MRKLKRKPGRGRPGVAFLPSAQHLRGPAPGRYLPGANGSPQGGRRPAFGWAGERPVCGAGGGAGPGREADWLEGDPAAPRGTCTSAAVAARPAWPRGGAVGPGALQEVARATGGDLGRGVGRGRTWRSRPGPAVEGLGMPEAPHHARPKVRPSSTHQNRRLQKAQRTHGFEDSILSTEQMNSRWQI